MSRIGKVCLFSLLFLVCDALALGNVVSSSCNAGDITACVKGECSFVAMVSPVHSNNVNVVGEDVYFTLFEPAPSERWSGNIKKLVLRDVNHKGIYSILDVVNLALAESGFEFVEGVDEQGIRMDALTFWTQPQSLAYPDKNKNEVEGKDGRSVRRGGVGQRMPATSPPVSGDHSVRHIYTENSGDNGFMLLDAVNAATSLFHLFKFDDNATYGMAWFSAMAGLPAVMPAQERQAAIGKMLVDYAYGADISSEAYGYQDALPTYRNWVLGDVIHSRPLVVDYGKDPVSNGGGRGHRRIIFGANDGMLHVFDNAAEENFANIIESFAFMPRELLQLLPILAADKGRYKNASGHSTHPYGMDGQVTLLVFDDTSNPDNTVDVIDADIPGIKDFAFIYAGMRRGGKSYYALDITDPLAAPQYIGSIKKQDADFPELGLTFSNAIPVIVKFDENVTPALVFSGGYTLAKDDYRRADGSRKKSAARQDATGFFDNTHGTTPDTEGNAIYIVNAITLELIWKSTGHSQYGNNDSHYYSAGLDVAIPSTVKPLDSDGDGFMDRLYVGDLAGNVWRGDFPACGKVMPCGNGHHRRDNWTLTRIAAFSTPSAAGDVRFFHPPAVVSTRDHLGNYDAIVIGSGDRENPLERTDVNRIYMIKDRHTVSGIPPADVMKTSDLVDVTLCVSGLELACAGSKSMVNGWRIDLPSGVGVDTIHVPEGEKVLSQPVVVDGKILLTTYQPLHVAVDSCVPEKGFSNLYLIDLQDGTAANDNSVRYVEIASGMVGDVTIAGQNIVLPGVAPLDFLMSDDEMKEYAAAMASIQGANVQAMDADESPAEIPGNTQAMEGTPGKVSVFPAGVAGIELLYWREIDIGDTR